MRHQTCTDQRQWFYIIIQSIRVSHENNITAIYSSPKGTEHLHRWDTVQPGIKGDQPYGCCNHPLFFSSLTVHLRQGLGGIKIESINMQMSFKYFNESEDSIIKNTNKKRNCNAF
jgi:hypothetical protein